MKYNLSVCGGTFDHLHLGHKEFLRFALSKTKKLLIGLTTEEFVYRNKQENNMQSYEERRNELEAFLSGEQFTDRVVIEPINDAFIPDVWSDFQIESIFVSEKTLLAATMINKIRYEQKKYPLIVEIVPIVKSEDLEYISSSRIRRGEIDRNGKPYILPSWKENDLFLPLSLRKELQKPFGMLVSNWEKVPGIEKKENMNIATVGDVTTRNAHDHGIIPHIAVIDLRIGRIKKVEFSTLGFSNEKIHHVVENPAGLLTGGVFSEIQEIFQRGRNENYILEIVGEEDLCVLPLVLSAPLSYHVFYGQPGEGMVEVEVTEDVKKRAYDLVSRFALARDY